MEGTANHDEDARQRLVRALITEIIVDIGEAAGEIVLVIHWKSGQHSDLRIRKPRAGEHGTPHPCRRSPSWAAWQADGQIRASRVAEPNGNADARFATYAASTATALPRRMASGRRCAMPLQNSVLAIIKFASSSRPESSVKQADHARRATPDRSVRSTSQVSGLLLRSSKKIAHVGAIPKNRFQCLQALGKWGVE